MGAKTLELNAVCVADWESNHLREINPRDPFDGFLGGIASFIKDAGGITVRDGVVSAFESDGVKLDGDEDSDEDFWAPLREDYRKESGFEVPPVMRVKVTVEVETLSPEESKRLWEAHRSNFLIHQRRAQDYANALQEVREFNEGLKANLKAGQQPSADELNSLRELEARVAKLQPRFLRWLVTTREGSTFQVSTWDRINSCVVVGAFAEIPRRDPASNTAKVRRVSYLSSGMGDSDRESDHRMAVETLGANNDWWVTNITRNGETWNP